MDASPWVSSKLLLHGLPPVSSCWGFVTASKVLFWMFLAPFNLWSGGFHDNRETKLLGPLQHTWATHLCCLIGISNSFFSRILLLLLKSTSLFVGIQPYPQPYPGIELYICFFFVTAFSRLLVFSPSIFKQFHKKHSLCISL